MADERDDEGERRAPRPPLLRRVGNTLRAGAKKLRDTGLQMAKAIASSPAALATLAAALGIGAVATGVALNGAATENRASVEQVAGRVADLQDQADLLDRRAVEIDAAVSALATQVAAVDSSAANRADELSAGIATQAEQIASLATDLSSLAGEVRGLPVAENAAAIAGLTMDVSSVAGDLATVAAVLNKTIDNVDGVSALLAVQAAELDDVEDAMGVVQSDLRSTQGDLAAAVGRISSVENDLAEVTADLAETLERMAATDAEIEDLGRLVSQARDAAVASQSAADAAQVSADEALTRVGAAETDVDNLEAYAPQYTYRRGGGSCGPGSQAGSGPSFGSYNTPLSKGGATYIATFEIEYITVEDDALGDPGEIYFYLHGTNSWTQVRGTSHTQVGSGPFTWTWLTNDVYTTHILRARCTANATIGVISMSWQRLGARP